MLVDSVDIIMEQRIKTQNLSNLFCANMNYVRFPAVAKLHNLLHIKNVPLKKFSVQEELL